MSSESNDPNKNYEEDVLVYTQEELDEEVKTARVEATSEAVQAYKLAIQTSIKEKMDQYEGMAKSSALDAVKGAEKDREQRERSAMNSYNTFNGLNQAYDIIRYQW